MLRSVDGSSTIASFSTPGPVTIGTLGSETITSNSATVKTLNYFSTGTSLPSTLGNVPFSIDMISLTMANNMAATHKPFGTQQVTPLDLTVANPSLKGFSGGFTDGRYGYFVPSRSVSGLVARVDLQNFATGGVTPLDLTVANPLLKGFQGGFTDGRYGYFVPNFDGSDYSGLVARVDLQNFTVGGVTTLDLTTVNSLLRGFLGGFTDGRYGYFVPNFNGSDYSGLVARVDLQNFATGGVTTLDLTAADPLLKGFWGGFTDGRYGYFVPNYYGSYSALVARVDLQNFATGGVTTLDLGSANLSLRGFSGGFTDGRYGYFVPGRSISGLVARVDLQNFATGGVTPLDLTAADPSLKGFAGGFTDGRYGYFVPSYNGAYFGVVARVDLQNFATGGVTTLDLSSVNASLKGFAGGFTDGRYGYFVPNLNGPSFDPHGLVARVQITVPPYLYNGF